MGFLVRFASVLAVVALCAPTAPAAADTTVRVGGSTNITPPIAKMVPAYQAAHAGTTVTVAGSNSGQGIAQLKAGDLDVACSDVAVNDDAFNDTVVGVIGIAFVVGNGAGVKNLTRNDVQGIYSGKITNWKQLGGNDLAIVPFSRPLGAGTRFVFETNVAKTLIDMKEQKDATAVVNAVSQTPGGVGYASVNYIGDHQDLVVNYEGVAPTDANIASHKYKFSADEHIYTLKSASPEIKTFVAYVATQQAIFKAGGIVAVTDPPANAATLRVQGTLNQAAPLQKIAADYKAQRGLDVEVKATNSGEGIAALRAGTIDVAAADVEISDPSFTDTTVGVLGIAFIAGPNTGLKNITRDQLIKIYGGAVTNWKQLGGADQPIVVYSRNIGTGTRLLLEQTVAKQTVDSRNPVKPSDLVEEIAKTPGSIGYVASYFVADRPQLVLTYNGVMPTPETIRNHTYAFSTDEHLYTRKDGPAAARDFVTFVTSQRATLASFGIY